MDINKGVIRLDPIFTNHLLLKESTKLRIFITSVLINLFMILIKENPLSSEYINIIINAVFIYSTMNV